MSMEDEIRVLSQIEGPLYLALRDSLIAREAGKADLIARFRKDADWRLSTTAAALQGWTEQAPLYGSIVTEIQATNPQARSRQQTGISGIWDQFAARTQAEFGPRVLPLAWEHIVKLSKLEPAWQTATYLAMLTGAPMEASIEPVIHLLNHTEEDLLRTRAAVTLSHLPAAAVAVRLERLSGHARELLKAVETAQKFRR